jgi:hypothetical protein
MPHRPYYITQAEMEEKGSFLYCGIRVSRYGRVLS